MRVQDLQVLPATVLPSIGPVRRQHWQAECKLQSRKGPKGTVFEAELKPNWTGSQLMSFQLQAKNPSEQRSFRDSFSQQMPGEAATAALHVGEENNPPQQRG